MSDFLQDLVRFPTLNPPAESYREYAEFIGGRYRKLGYEVMFIAAEGDPEHSRRFPRVNLMGRWGQAGPTVHFSGHFDVVPPGVDWTMPPFDARLVDGRLYGRGVANQKASLAASLYAMEALRRVGALPEFGIVEQSATENEKSGSFTDVALLCRLGLIAAGRPDFVIITEPLGYDRICIGHHGVYWFEVVARGRTAHGSMPSLGLNAAEIVSVLVARLTDGFKPRLAQRRTAVPDESPLARQPSTNFNSLRGGQVTDDLETPCVPDTCRAVCDRRFIEEETFEDVRSVILALVKRTEAEFGGDY